ncbi:MAG: FAD:protein FMN transferase [Acidimicrobiales bacterium]
MIVVGGPPGLDRRAEERIADLEQRWSRFRPESELSRLNEAPRGRPTLVSADTFVLLDRAVRAWRLTGGRYDPTVLDAVVANGYDRSFADLPATSSDPTAACRPAPGCADLELDARLNAVTIPPGASIDPGGIGKGLAADLVAEELLAHGAEGVLVDLGGDVRVAGHGPHHGGWVVDVEHPLYGDRALLHLLLRDAGIATSSRLRRRWHRNGVPRHHLLDPATGAPTVGTLVAATVVAGEAWWAEALTKAAFVGGLDAVAGASALLVDDAGTCTGTPDLLALAA